MVSEQTKSLIVFSFFLIALAIGPAHASKQPHLSLDDLKGLDKDASDYERISKFMSSDDRSSGNRRLEAVRQAASVLGSQHGYIERLNQLKDEFKDIEDILDDQWDFDFLMRLANGKQNGKYLIPPSIKEAEGVKEVSDDQRTIRVSERVFSIERPERLALRAPNWRSYLIYDQDVDATVPPKALFPETSEEQSAWESATEEGWRQGQRHAEREMAYRVQRMSEDFRGMMRYVKLVLKGKMEETRVSYSHEVVNQRGEMMKENEHTYQIAVPARFNSDAAEWDPIILSPRDSLTFPIESGYAIDPLER